MTYKQAVLLSFLDFFKGLGLLVAGFVIAATPVILSIAFGMFLVWCSTPILNDLFRWEPIEIQQNTMSLLNKQNIKALALDVATTYDPEKTRVSMDFIKQLEDIVAAVVIQQVRGQDFTGATLKDTDWGDKVINNAKQVFTKLELSDYLRGI